MSDPSLEVVLSDVAVLTEINYAVLTPGVLPGLWDKESITLVDLASYFSGKHFVAIDKGGYTENLLIPAAEEAAIKVPVSAKESVTK